MLVKCEVLLNSIMKFLRLLSDRPSLKEGIYEELVQVAGPFVMHADQNASVRLIC